MSELSKGQQDMNGLETKAIIALVRNLRPFIEESHNDLESKKPSGMGVNVKDYKSILNKKLIKNKRKNDFLQYDDLSD